MATGHRLIIDLVLCQRALMPPDADSSPGYWNVPTTLDSLHFSLSLVVSVSISLAATRVSDCNYFTQVWWLKFSDGYDNRASTDDAQGNEECARVVSRTTLLVPQRLLRELIAGSLTFLWRLTTHRHTRVILLRKLTLQSRLVCVSNFEERTESEFQHSIYTFGHFHDGIIVLESFQM